MKSVHIGPFLGMNNQLPQTQYNVPDEGDFVRDARNVDILDSGTLRRRSGYTKLLDGRFSSLYAMGSTALCVHDGYLCRVNAADCAGCGACAAVCSFDALEITDGCSIVNEEKCMGCGACAEVCTYGALEVRETKQGRKVFVNPVLCKGDGLCNTKCPTGAIQLKHYTDDEVECEIDVVVPDGEIEKLIDAAAAAE